MAVGKACILEDRGYSDVFVHLALAVMMVSREATLSVRVAAWGIGAVSCYGLLEGGPVRSSRNNAGKGCGQFWRSGAIALRISMFMYTFHHQLYPWRGRQPQ